MGCGPYIPPSTSIPTGVEVSAPSGWQDYCTRHPEDASCRGEDERWQELVKVQMNVNCDVKYTTDMTLYSRPDFWEVAEDRGDCEDYVLTKRNQLDKLGWSKIKDLAIALCWTETGGYHAVLVAKTDKGDYVLDNRHNTVKDWAALPYRWNKIQDGKKWRRIGD